MTTIVREFSAAGPCLTLGKLVKQIAQFYVYAAWMGGQNYGKEKRIRKRTAHIEACPFCRDHAQTHYPNGYMD